MLVALLERFLPRGYKLYPEFLLHRLPQRVDILVVRLEQSEPGPVEKIHSILDYLAAHTLIEYTRAFLSDPMGIQPLDRAEAEVYLSLYQQVEQFKRTRGPMAVKDADTFEERMVQVIKSLSANHPELLRQILAQYPPETRFEVLSSDEVLRGLSPEQREQLKRLLH